MNKSNVSNMSVENLSNEILKIYGDLLYIDDKKILEAVDYITKSERFLFNSSKIIEIDGIRNFRLIDKDILTYDLYEKIINYSLYIIPYQKNENLDTLFSFIRALKSNLYYREWEVNKNGTFLEFAVKIKDEFVAETDKKIIKKIDEVEKIIFNYLYDKDKINFEKRKQLIDEIRKLLADSLFTYQNEHIQSIVMLLKILLVFEDLPNILALKADPINKLEA